MRALGVLVQVMILAIFVIFYIAAVIPAAAITAMRSPVIKPARRVKTSVGLGKRRIY